MQVYNDEIFFSFFVFLNIYGKEQSIKSIQFPLSIQYSHFSLFDSCEIQFIPINLFFFQCAGIICYGHRLEIYSRIPPICLGKINFRAKTWTTATM